MHVLIGQESTDLYTNRRYTSLLTEDERLNTISLTKISVLGVHDSRDFIKDLIIIFEWCIFLVFTNLI